MKYLEILFITRVHIDKIKLTDAAKQHLNGTILLPYNTSKFIADIKDEGAKQGAKIWVSFTIYVGHNVLVYTKPVDSVFDAI